MLAVRKVAPGVGNVAVEEVPIPKPGPGEVLLRITAAGICGTDVHIVQDEFVTEPPVTMGHELAGTISDLGAGVTGWQVGDRVTSETYFYTCGECRYCRSGRPNLCAKRRSIGSRVDGAFAEYMVTPAKNLHRVPDELPLETAALTEPLACVVHGVIDTAGVRAGDRVAVTGPGPIGQLAALVAKAAGARVLLVGTAGDEARLAVARRLGIDTAVSADDNLKAAALEVLGEDGADLVIECSGAAPAAATLLELGRKGGRYSQVGLYGKPIQLDMDVVCYKELVVTGTNATVPSAWPRALRLLADGLPAQELVTHRFALSDWDEALAAVTSKVGVKVLLVPDSAHRPPAGERS